MEGPHSLLAMCASAEKQIPQPYLILRKSPPQKKKKNQHMKNFQTTEDKLVAVYSSREEDAQGIAFVRRKTKNMIWDMKKPKFQNNATQRTLREKKELIF